MAKIKKCEACSRYTLTEHCPECGAETADPEPPAFSYPDTYGEYRRKTKQQTRGDTNES